MTGPATDIIRRICNGRRNSDLCADDREIQEALNQQMDKMQVALRAAEPLLRLELTVLLKAADPCASDINDTRSTLEAVRKALGIEFACHECGKTCDTAPQLPAMPVCPEHCEDHDYEYVRGERGHFCRHCNQPRPEDWSND
jgi:hypothetical protein